MSIESWDPTKLTLVVDLDDTLIQTDSLFENFWSACATKWQTPLLAASALRRGPLALKQQFAAIATIDPTRLPYNDDVLEVIRDWRERGGESRWSPRRCSRRPMRWPSISGCSTKRHGSGEGVNLKGADKARFLQDRFPGGYTYIGDAAADVPVWELAAAAVTVNSSEAFRARVDALGKDTEHLRAGSAKARDYLRVMRPASMAEEPAGLRPDARGPPADRRDIRQVACWRSSPSPGCLEHLCAKRSA